MTQKNPSFTWQRDHICFLLPIHYYARGCCLHVHGLSLAGLLSGPPYTWTQSPSGQVCSAHVFRSGGTLCVRSWPTPPGFSDSGTAPWQFSVPVMVGSAACGHQGCCEQQDEGRQKAGPGPGVPSGASRLWTTCSRLTQGNCLK